MREDFFKILPELSEKQFFMNKSAKKMYFCKLKTHIMFIKFHRDNPNQRYVKMIIDCLNNDGVIIFPPTPYMPWDAAFRAAKLSTE